MSKIRKLENPPIQKAIIELRFSNELKLSDEEFENIKKEINFDLKSENLFADNININFNPNNNSPKSEVLNVIKKLIGFKFISDDNKYNYILRNDRISFIQINEYDNFDDFFNRFLDFKNKLIKYLKDIKIIRIGLRYINNIKVDDYENTIDNKYHLLINNNVAENEYSEFRSIYKYDDNIGSKVDIIYKAENKEILIDIDSYKTELFIELNDENEIKSIFNKLRENKNYQFFKIISSNYVGV